MPTNRKAEAFWIESKQYWQIKVQRDGIRKAFTSSIKGRKGKHAAEAKADEWLSKGTSDMRFPAAWEIYMNEHVANTSKSNIQMHQCTYKNSIYPIIKDRKLSSITAIMWQSCLDSAAKRGLSERSCMDIKNIIGSFVSYALRSRWDIARLMKGDLKIPKFAKPSKPKQVLSPDEIRILFTDPCYTKHKKPVEAHYIHAWRFLVATGLRRGELCGLKTEDVQGNVLSVKRAVTAFNDISAGKNANAQRTIELTPTAMKVLEDQKEMLAEKGIISPWLFCDADGEMPSPMGVYDQWRRYRSDHGITATLHELRHTFISLNKNDLPLELLKSVVGHSSSMDTFGVYGHEIEGERHKAAEIIDGVFRHILDEK